MASNYPGTIDVFTNPGTATAISGTVSHAGQHSDANDAIEALEAKVGVSASTAVAGKILVGSGNGTTSWSNSITIPVAGNVTGLTVTQSDTTNNPVAARINNSSSERALYVVQTGVLADSKYALQVYSTANQTNASNLLRVFEAGTSTHDLVNIENDGTGQCLYIQQDGVLASSKYALYVYSNAVQVNSSLVFFHQDNASSTSSVVYIDNDGTGTGVTINQDGAGRALHIALNANTPENVAAVFITSTVAQTNTGSYFVLVRQDHPSSTKTVFAIDNDGTGVALLVQQDGTPDTAAISLSGCTGTSTKNPESDAETGWLKIVVDGTARYVPFYAAS